ncbi:MAG: hypothetical protein DRH04_03525 [Deltaproteobacteria bacterium]|nr:MAG: hypothetical protein DRH04_03525 [Deltaproteobacteria bacterium]
MNKAINAMVRRAAGVKNQSVPVLVADNEGHKPLVLGTPGGWFTRGGTPIHAPTTYRNQGWSNMVYECDDRQIIVGEKWITRKITSLVKQA